MTGIHKAIDLAGGQEKLANALGISQQAVSDWMQQGFVPIPRIVPVLDIVDPKRETLSSRDLMSMSVVRLADGGI